MIDKELIKQAIRQILTDRTFVLLIIFMLALSLVYTIAVTLSIHPSDVTVYSRYTAFGEAHFYKSHWQYLLGFAVFGPAVAAAHIALMVKLYAIDRRQTALLLGWLGIVLLVISLMYAMAVLGLGYAA